MEGTVQATVIVVIAVVVATALVESMVLVVLVVNTAAEVHLMVHHTAALQARDHMVEVLRHTVLVPVIPDQITAPATVPTTTATIPVHISHP